jgi:hypothetical protein
MQDYDREQESMMRTSRLRRWVLRGALFSVTVIVPVVIAQPVQADWTWQNAPPAAPTSHQPGVGPNPGQVVVQSDDWTWQ